MPNRSNLQELKEKVGANLADVRHKLVVLSGKGGVGKSSLAVNLSVLLADTGQKVCLLDTDIHGPNVPRLLNLQGSLPEISDSRIHPVPFGENMGVMSPSFLHVSQDAAVIWRGPMKSTVIYQMLTGVEWGQLDYLLVDCPPGTGDEPLTVAQMIPPPVSAILITTPQEVALDDVRKAAEFCDRVGLPVAGLIENMSGMLCPHCGKQVDLYKKGGGKQAAASLNIPFLGEVPFDPGMVISCDKGVPFVREFKNTPAARIIGKIAAGMPVSGQSRP